MNIGWLNDAENTGNESAKGQGEFWLPSCLAAVILFFYRFPTQMLGRGA
ncbi:hypothetical protein [Paenibacillus oralis]|nr:hypothetical protein [Paenibacillus oralis]